ncbi:hypothetical protein BV25DRAFT_1918600 [Artomyces pyxidatus]|uniref:Uncharacterized protein n=1 Tax=Artomyces pyxidatus TaxID=48021 RepID=A0ACB8ST84_9AGAM|nr:hypothetical protein BV25DRAFT_1918600 [Artomyces pyxidatus]
MPRVATVGTAVSCPKCGIVISRKSDLARHNGTKHTPKDKQKKHACSVPGCKYSASQKSNLKTHIRAKHTNERLFCPDCVFDCADPGLMVRHRKDKHGYEPHHSEAYLTTKGLSRAEYIPAAVLATKSSPSVTPALTFSPSSAPSSMPPLTPPCAATPLTKLEDFIFEFPLASETTSDTFCAPLAPCAPSPAPDAPFAMPPASCAGGIATQPLQALSTDFDLSSFNLLAAPAMSPVYGYQLVPVDAEWEGILAGSQPPAPVPDFGVDFSDFDFSTFNFTAPAPVPELAAPVAEPDVDLFDSALYALLANVQQPELPCAQPVEQLQYFPVPQNAYMDPFFSAQTLFQEAPVAPQPMWNPAFPGASPAELVNAPAYAAYNTQPAFDGANACY